MHRAEVTQATFISNVCFIAKTTHPHAARAKYSQPIAALYGSGNVDNAKAVGCLNNGIKATREPTRRG